MTRALRAVILVAASGLVAPRVALADEPSSGTGVGGTGAADAANNMDSAQEAKQQYAAGSEAYGAKRFVEAALHFEAATSRRAHAAALYSAALAWEQANRPERAADDFARAVDVPGLSVVQVQNARSRLAVLERMMGTLDVTAPEGWRVQLDANTEAPAPAHLHAMPGTHSLTIVAPGAPIRRRDVSLELGKTSRMDLAAEPEPPPVPVVKAQVSADAMGAPPTARAPEWWSLRRGLGVGVVGLGVASLASGIVLGSSALDARDAYLAGPTRASFDHASSLQTWTNVTFIAGGVLLAGGAALVLWPAAKKGEPGVSFAPAPGGAVVRGSF